MRRATIYRHKGKYILIPVSETTKGFTIDSEPGIVLYGEVTTQEVGEAVLSTLSVSRTGIAHPKDWKDVSAIAPRLAGVRSWSELMKGDTVSCAIEENAESRIVRPLRNLGPKVGFAPLAHGEVKLSVTTNSLQLGEAVIEVLKAAE